MSDPRADYLAQVDAIMNKKPEDTSYLGFDVGDRVTVQGSDAVWVIASIDKMRGNVQLRQGDEVGFAKVTSIQHHRTHNKPTDTPVRRRDVTEF